MLNIILRGVFVLGALLSIPGAASAQIYGNDPDWRSTDRHYATGGGWVDLDRDGWPELVVSNGNDIVREKVGVYDNVAGTLSISPSWESTDRRFHGHLAIGDVDRDGYEDVAVAVLLHDGGSGVKYYRNQGGTLSSSPIWQSANIYNAWHCAFGDPDLDGDLDLLVGSSDAYGTQRWKNFIYFNQDGVLDTTPGWRSDDRNNLDHMEFCDLDDDGDLDVVAIGSQTSNFIYRNVAGAIEAVPDWSSTDNLDQFANTLALGDVDGDGRRDLVMSDNNQINSGSGRFKLYRGRRNGKFEKTYGWSYFDGYVSAVALADLDNDGRLDLATGAWWDKTRLFLNNGSGFNTSPSWNSNPTIVVEAIAFGDVDRDGLVNVIESKDIDTGRTLPTGPSLGWFHGRLVSQPPRKLYYLDHAPVESVTRVVVNGVELAPDEYCVHRMHGWVSLSRAPRKSVRIDYVCSTMLDMAVTDWENNGNMVYVHR